MATAVLSCCIRGRYVLKNMDSTSPEGKLIHWVRYEVAASLKVHWNEWKPGCIQRMKNLWEFFVSRHRVTETLFFVSFHVCVYVYVCAVQSGLDMSYGLQWFGKFLCDLYLSVSDTEFNCGFSLPMNFFCNSWKTFHVSFFAARCVFKSSSPHVILSRIAHNLLICWVVSYYEGRRCI